MPPTKTDVTNREEPRWPFRWKTLHLVLGAVYAALSIGGISYFYFVRWSRPPVGLASSVARDEVRPKETKFVRGLNGERVQIELFSDLFAIKGNPDLLRSADRQNTYTQLVDETDALASFSRSGFFLCKAKPGASQKLMQELKRDAESSDIGLVAHLGVSDTSSQHSLAIVTSELIVEFKSGVLRSRVDELANGLGAVVVRPLMTGTNAYVIRSSENSPLRTIDLSNQFYDLPEANGVSHPNFLVDIDSRSDGLGDPLRVAQWHLDTIHAPDAWQVSRGNGVLMAVVDEYGVFVNHEDLIRNKFVNKREIPDNGVDDDGNGLIDDVSGWSFGQNRGPIPYVLGPKEGHGTAVAGLAVAQCGNGKGICGVAPEASVLGIQIGQGVGGIAEAISYASDMGADVINNSWGLKLSDTPAAVIRALQRAIVSGRKGRGSVVVFSMTNRLVDNFTGQFKDISSIPGAIAVGRSTDQEKWGHSGFGSGMALLAPSGATSSTPNADCQLPLVGTLEIVSSYTPGYAGSTGPGSVCSCNPNAREGAEVGYTHCFQGTSASAPIISGVAALILSVNPQLTAADVRNVLIDSADKIEPQVANYVSDASGRPFSQTHGYGRVNAKKAVELAKSFHPSTVTQTSENLLVSIANSKTSPSVSAVSQRSATRNTTSVKPTTVIGVRDAVQANVRIAGRQAIVVDVPSNGRPKRIYLWRDVRVLLLASNVRFDQFLGFLGSGFRPVKQYNWPADLLNDRAFVVESTEAGWRQASEKLDAAAEDGRLLGFGRVGFDSRDGGPHAKLVLSGFTATLTPNHTADDLKAEASTLGLVVTVRQLGDADIIVRPRKASIDPLSLLTLGTKMVSSGVLKQGSVEIDWAAPVQSR